MIQRSSRVKANPYRTTQKPGRIARVVPLVSLLNVPADADDAFDVDDTLTLLSPDEDTAQGRNTDGVSSFYLKVNADGADFAAWDTGATHPVRISVHYLDSGTEVITIGYSSNGTSENATKALVTKTNTGEWKWKDVTISDLFIDNTAYTSNDNADFRIYSSAAFYLNAVKMRETTLKIKVVWKADEFDVDVQDQENTVVLDPDLIGPWSITEDYLVYDTGTDATSMGMSPEDYPFYAGATYANRASAPFRVTPAGAATMTSANIGGWTVTSTEIKKTGIILDSSADAIYVGSGTPRLVIDGANKRFRTSTYTAGLQGFTIEGSDGSAEFNNITARGELHASVMSYSEIHAVAGTWGIFKSAGKLRADVTTATSPTTFNVDIEDPDTGHVQLFAVGDILRIKDGSGLDNWLSISSVSDQTTFYRYVCTKTSGTNGTFRAGAAVVDYGASGQGFITFSADGTVGNAPNITFAKHAGSPHSAQTVIGVLGNLNGAYGYGSTTYGAAFGEYATGIANVTIDSTNGVRLRKYTATAIHLQVDGDVFIGSDVSAAATTAFSVFTNAQTYNGESVGAGDILLGDNSSSVPNLFFDASEGNVSLRSGTAEKVTIGSLGSTFTGIMALTPGTTTVTSGTIDLDVGLAAGFLYSNFYISSSTGNFSIRGIATPSDDGTILFLDYGGSHNMTFSNNAGAPAGYSDILTGDGTSPTTGGQGWGLFIYNASKGNWRLIANKT